MIRICTSIDGTSIGVLIPGPDGHATPGSAVEVRECGLVDDTLVFLTDSMMALCTTTGAWKPKKHKVLVGRNAKLLAALRARGIQLIAG